MAGGLLLIILEAFCVRPSLGFSWSRNIIAIIPTWRSSLHLNSISLIDVNARHRLIFMHLGDQVLAHIAIRLEVLQVLETVDPLIKTSYQQIIRYTHGRIITFFIVFGTSTPILSDYNLFQRALPPYLLRSPHATN